MSISTPSRERRRVDVASMNLERCLAFEARPDDALIVAGDVCSEPLLFEKFFGDVVKKFKYVFYVPGNHDLWCLSDGDFVRYVRYVYLCTM